MCEIRGIDRIGEAQIQFFLGNQRMAIKRNTSLLNPKINIVYQQSFDTFQATVSDSIEFRLFNRPIFSELDRTQSIMRLLLLL